MEKKYFQDFMPENVCFGCGNNNHEGLQIKSYWENDESVLIWKSEEKYHGCIYGGKLCRHGRNYGSTSHDAVLL